MGSRGQLVDIVLTHQKYEAVLITAYKGTMNKIRTMSDIDEHQLHNWLSNERDIQRCSCFYTPATVISAAT